MATCSKCGALYSPDYGEAEEGGFINPLKMRALYLFCPDCRTPEATGTGADE